MMPGKLPVVVWSGVIRLLGLNIKCYTLDDGRRMVDQDDLNALLKALGDDNADMNDSDFAAFERWRRGYGSAPEVKN